MNTRSFRLLLLLCGLVFAAALWGSVNCGQRLDLVHISAEEKEHLRHLIYFHFALAQLSVGGAIVLAYLRHRAGKRHYLLVSYNEQGLHLNPPGIRIPTDRVHRCHLGNLAQAPLPASGSPVLVYPMFMLSGASSGARLTAALQEACTRSGTKPQFYHQPVLGASPWLAQAAANSLRPQLTPETGVLVVAHGSKLPEPPPEPALFCRRLRELLPAGTEIRTGYFQQSPEAADVLRQMKARRVLLLPFLLTEGIHTHRDLPTPAQAAACGKELVRLPVVASLLSPDTP